MTIAAADFLRRLAGGGGSVGGTASPGHAGFAGVLSKASGRAAGSGIGVTVEPFAGVELSAEQLERVSRAGDAAERAGAMRALVLVDDQMLLMDVTTRRITGKADPEAEVLTGLDAVVRVPSAGSAGAAASVGVVGLPGKGAFGVSPALLRALSQQSAGDQGLINEEE